MAILKGPLGEDYDDEDLTLFLYIPGRYYLAQWCVRLPNDGSKFGKGGDVTALIWRKIDEPEKWTFQYRFRWYQSDDPWDGKDEKEWFAGHPTGPEESILQKTREILYVLALSAGHTNTGEFLIQGDKSKFHDLVEKNPPVWLHTQTVIQE